MKYRNTLLKVCAVTLLLGPPATLAADPVAPAETAKPAMPAKAKKAVADCAIIAGSRVRPAMGRSCESSAFGPRRTYTQRDIELTGESDLAEALRKLDPVFR